MPIHLELKPEVEERLGRAAEAVGLSVEAYVEDLIERQVTGPRERSPRVDMKEVDRVLDSLSEGVEGSPALPPKVYTREGIYREHD
jgi:hypothetical protein